MTKIDQIWLMVFFVVTGIVTYVTVVKFSFEDFKSAMDGFAVWLIGTVVVLYLASTFLNKPIFLMFRYLLLTLAFTVFIGVVVSLATGESMARLTDPDYLFRHDAVYILLASETVGLFILPKALEFEEWEGTYP